MVLDPLDFPESKNQEVESAPRRVRDSSPVHAQRRGDLFRPDTAYLFGHVVWRSDVAATLNDALRLVTGPNTKDLLARVDSYLAELDPFSAEKLRSLPFHELISEVKSAQSEIWADSDAIPSAVVTLAGRVFNVVAWSPRRGCHFQLQSGGISLHGRLSSARPNSPNLYLEIGSIPLWACPDWQKYFIDWRTWLCAISQKNIDWHISRIDLAFHTQFLQAQDIDRAKFVCRAETRRVYTVEKILDEVKKAHFADEYARQVGMPAVSMSAFIEKLEQESGMSHCDFFKGDVPQMIGFGSRSRLYARIYNKTREVARKPEKCAVFGQIWAAAGFNMDKDVINVEFELHRSWLKSRELVVNGSILVLDSLTDFLSNFPALIAYLLGSNANEGWLRMIEKTNTRATRCDTATGWDLLREATALIPKIAIRERERVLTRATAARVLPQAVRLKARLDTYLGREIDAEDISVESILRTIAEVVNFEMNIERSDSWTDFALIQAYQSEVARIKVQDFHQHSNLPRFSLAS